MGMRHRKNFISSRITLLSVFNNLLLNFHCPMRAGALVGKAAQRTASPMPYALSPMPDMLYPLLLQ
jgi:hypothetical protein